jgi:hypothetical protein
MFRDNLLVRPSDGADDKGRGEGTVLSSLSLVVVVADCMFVDLHLIARTVVSCLSSGSESE